MLLLPGLPSVAGDEIDAVFVSVRSSAAGSPVTVRINVLVVTSNAGLVQLMAPAAPTAGVVHIQPTGLVKETNAVLAGAAMVSATSLANSGPLLLARMVYVMDP